MEQNYKIEGAKMTYYMPREVDHHSAGEMKSKMDMLIDMHGIRELEMDFSKTEFMDSSGIGVMIGRSKKLHYYGGRICASNLSEHAYKLFRASGMHRIIEVKEDTAHVS